MKHSLKLYTFLILGFCFIISANQVQAIFHNEGWSYFLQNTTTGEVKYFNLQWDAWNGWFNEIYDNKIDYHKIPIKNFFSNWDLVGYDYQWRHANFQCKWDMNGLKLDVETKYGVKNAEGNPCRKVSKTNKQFTLYDLSESDRLLYYIDYLVFILPGIIFGILVNFFVVIPILKYVFNFFKNFKPIHILYISFILSLLFALVSIIFGFSKLEISGSQFGGLTNLFYSILKSPFYVWGIIIFFKKFMILKFSYFKSDTINTFVSSILKFSIFLILFFLEISPFRFGAFYMNYIVIFITILLLFIFFIRRRDIEKYINANYLSGK